MASKSLPELIRAERDLDITKVINSGLPIIKSEDEKLIAACVAVTMGKFMAVCFPEQAKEALILEFSEEVIRNRFTWNVADLPMFFKFIKENQHDKRVKLIGNTLTYLKLMEMVGTYEDYRAEALEQYHEQKKRSMMGQGVQREQPTDDFEKYRIKSLMHGKDYQRQGRSDETFFEQNKTQSK